MNISIYNIASFVIGGVILGAPFFVIGYFVRKRFAERLIRTAESKAKEILTKAKRESEDTIDKTQKQAKTILAKSEKEFEDGIAERRRNLENLEKVLRYKEGLADEKVDILEKKEKQTQNKLDEAASKLQVILDKERKIDELVEQEKKALEKISRVDPEEAKKLYLQQLEVDCRTDAGKLILSIESKAEQEAEAKAKKILSLAMMRCAGAFTVESSTTVVHLPSEEMKGRIIGKDGRNIKTFETLTGVDLIIDETPATVTLSAFDGVRREIARLCLKELVEDGRIQPARIEEVVQKVKKNMEIVLKEEGEKAVLAANVNTMHPELVKLLGRLRYRTSYGQNVLDHSIEVAMLMNVIAAEMDIDPVLARKAGLLHDIGKAVSSDVDGPHALIGGEYARRYGEHPDVVHGIEAHHEDIPMQSVWPMLVQAADAISAARPGARRESLESYVKRLRALEDIADKCPGVDKSYAIQGGREVRIVVRPERVKEQEMPALAREISKRIEKELTFPGQIKVILIRETRVEDLAK